MVELTSPLRRSCPPQDDKASSSRIVGPPAACWALSINEWGPKINDVDSPETGTNKCLRLSKHGHTQLKGAGTLKLATNEVSISLA
jgi:hypothetical protein